MSKRAPEDIVRTKVVSLLVSALQLTEKLPDPFLGYLISMALLDASGE